MVPAAIFLSQLNPRSGAMLNSIGLNKLVYIGMAMMLVGYAILGTLGSFSWIACLIAAMLLEGGNAFIMMPAITAANNALPKNLVSHGTAIITTMRQVIGAGSVVVASILITAINTNSSFVHALLMTSRWFIVVPLIGLLLTVRIKSN